MNLEQLKQLHQKNLEVKEKKGTGGDFLKDYVRLEDGQNIVRILPDKDPKGSFFAEALIHKFQNEEGNWNSYYCNKMANADCPLCNLVQTLWGKHKALRLPKGEKSPYGNLASSVKAKPRYYVNVVDRRTQETKKDESPVKILVMSQELFDLVVKYIVNPEFLIEGEEQDSMITSLDKGNDFIVEVSKKGEYNSFAGSSARFKKSAAGTPQQIKVWMDSLHDIHNMLKPGDYEAGKKISMNLLAGLETVSSPPSKDVDDSDQSETKFKDSVKA